MGSFVGPRAWALLNELDGTTSTARTFVMANPTTTTTFTAFVRRGSNAIDFRRLLDR